MPIVTPVDITRLELIVLVVAVAAIAFAAGMIQGAKIVRRRFGSMLSRSGSRFGAGDL